MLHEDTIWDRLTYIEKKQQKKIEEKGIFGENQSGAILESIPSSPQLVSIFRSNYEIFTVVTSVNGKVTVSEFKSTVKSFYNIHLLVLFVYFVLQVCMGANLY